MGYIITTITVLAVVVAIANPSTRIERAHSHKYESRTSALLVFVIMVVACCLTALPIWAQAIIFGVVTSALLFKSGHDSEDLMMIFGVFSITAINHFFT